MILAEGEKIKKKKKKKKNGQVMKKPLGSNIGWPCLNLQATLH
jgi:hypothetical protein